MRKNAEELPCSEQAEYSVLGSALCSKEGNDIVQSSIVVEDFHITYHQAIYAAITALAQEGEPVDLITVWNRINADKMLPSLPDDALNWLTTLQQWACQPGALRGHIRILKDKSLKRQLLKAARATETECMADKKEASVLIQNMGDEISRIAVSGCHQSIIPIRDAAAQSMASIIEARSSDGGIMGVSTGFPSLDDLLSGLQKNQLIVIAGRPGMGKTSFALNIVQHAAMDRNVPCLMFSLEMGASELATRLICAQASVDMQKVRTGKIDQREFDRLEKAVEVISTTPIFIDESPDVSVNEMLARSRGLQRTQELGLIVIDYLQLMHGAGNKNENRVLEIAGITRSLKMMTKELGVPVLLLSQLSRAGEREGSKYPKLTDLRESGAIEQDADVVIFLQRDDYYVEEQTEENKGRAKLIVAKQRNGPTGSIDVQWNGELTRYMELDGWHHEEDCSDPVF